MGRIRLRDRSPSPALRAPSPGGRGYWGRFESGEGATGFVGTRAGDFGQPGPEPARPGEVVGLQRLLSRAAEFGDSGGALDRAGRLAGATDFVGVQPGPGRPRGEQVGPCLAV